MLRAVFRGVNALDRHPEILRAEIGRTDGFASYGFFLAASAYLR